METDMHTTSKRGLLPGMTEEHSVWDVYNNNEAKKVDTELVKDWTATLNSLLLFVSLLVMETLSPSHTCKGGHLLRCFNRICHREQEPAGTRSCRCDGGRDDFLWQ